ncbi:uncharacterized protein [Branchiostoma lanceolatum]|uniref:uncharacterized protein isoform X3 n=1 Tax=Branchiostoma lanceolatum TaxID=7740 RepID=UPI003453DCC1
MLLLLLCSCVFLAIGGHGQSVLPISPWPVYHQNYLQTGFCEYSFLLSVQNSEGICLLPANVSTRLEEIERDRTLEKQSMKHLSSSLSELSEQVHNLTMEVNKTSTELTTKLTADQAESRARDEEIAARDLLNVTHVTESTRQQIELLQGEQMATNLVLQQSIEQQNQTIEELKTLVRQQSQGLDELKTRIEQQSADTTTTTTTTGPAVAFSVSKTTPLGPVNGHTRVVFDRVHVNIGNRYNPDDGIFTCDTAGTYMFTYFMYKDMEVPQMAAFLVLNTTIQNVIFENNSKMDDELHYGSDMAGNSLMLNLKACDMVSIYLRKNDSIYSSEFNNYCTFSGFLLK